MNKPAVSHPLFARFFYLIGPIANKAGGDAHRKELLSGLSGRVIELGAGTGLNFPFYPPTVTEVLAIEPEPFMRKKAIDSARVASVDVKVVDGVDSNLPAENCEYDAAVVSLVLCSVSDPGIALKEIRRVLRVGGELRFYEHIVAEEPRLARLQRRVDILWPYLGGGCHTSRDTVSAIETAGFIISSARRFKFQPSALAIPVSPHVIGTAIKG